MPEYSPTTVEAITPDTMGALSKPNHYFYGIFFAVLQSLDDFQDQNQKVFAKASVLLNNIAKSSFVIAIVQY